MAIIEARMTSTRLPGKVLLPAAGVPLLQILIQRLKRVTELDGIVVATTRQSTDDPIVSLARECGVGVFRGDEHDVLGRVRRALDLAGADVAVEITGDCPLADPAMVSCCIRAFLETRSEHSYLGNTTGPELGAPHGFDIEVFRVDALRVIDEETIDLEAREHVSLPFYRRDDRNRWRPRFLSFFPVSVCHQVWVSLDYLEDYELIKAAVETLTPRDRFFGADMLVEYCLSQPSFTAACLRRRGLDA